jgi:hypothetical protein
VTLARDRLTPRAQVPRRSRAPRDFPNSSLNSYVEIKFFVDVVLVGSDSPHAWLAREPGSRSELAVGDLLTEIRKKLGSAVKIVATAGLWRCWSTLRGLILGGRLTRATSSKSMCALNFGFAPVKRGEVHRRCRRSAGAP